MDSTQLFNRLKIKEGKRLHAYQDTRGIWTIGYGRNLQELVITDKQAEEWLETDMLDAIQEAAAFAEYSFLDTNARQNVLCEMVFNMGAPRVRNFGRMLAAIARQDWIIAAAEMVNSAWAKQVGDRATELAKMMFSGEFA